MPSRRGILVVMLRFHHLNCGTLRPFSAALLTGKGGLRERANLVCHCLLVETPHGLILVDSGLGLEDVRTSVARLGLMFLGTLAPLLDHAETAAEQIERLGFSRRDVRHVFLTHLDADHAGGIADFPEAQIHVLEDEFQAATNPRTLMERSRYRRSQWRHGPRWVRHRSGGEDWFGFRSVRPLDEREPDVAIVPLAGHTRGHAAIAIRTATGWLVHAGDSYLHHSELTHAARSPRGIEFFQRLNGVDIAARRSNRDRLRALALGHPDVQMFCAHDPIELERMRAGASGAVTTSRAG